MCCSRQLLEFLPSRSPAGFEQMGLWRRLSAPCSRELFNGNGVKVLQGCMPAAPI